ncbi:hypothetical protein LOK49_LG05G01868 [Camellia lanceoleosa]|uniref:Uncharacterized protein n=1 Tax=Camellia lanceoleosa TaxID=1840588 RepID=A0ACC0HM10_9ERIC|nr:hypothetical protein LOK49_LG05G01868 [Camellia lanceoleosa]
MAFLLTSPPPSPSLLPKNPNPTLLLCPTNPHSLSFFLLSKPTTTVRFSSLNPLSREPLTSNTLYNFSVDEWGDTDPPQNEDDNDNGIVGEEARVDDDNNDKLMELQRCLGDHVYGTDLGFQASTEVRAEVLELINQLKAANSTPVPIEATNVLDENWVLV